MGQSVSTAATRASDGQVHARRERHRHHRRRPPWSSPARARSAGSAVKGTQPVGYYKDPEKSAATFIDHRRRALLDPRRLRHGRGRRHAHAARPRLGVHQHRRREGLPRGGRGGAQDCTPPSATRSPSACPTTSSARPSPPWSSPRPATTIDEADVIAHVKGKLAALKAPKRVLVDRHHRPGPQRQGRLQAAEGLRRRHPGVLSARPDRGR